MTEQKQADSTGTEESNAGECMCGCGDISKMAEVMKAFCGGEKGDVDFSGMMAKIKGCCAEASE